jgi:Tfp pilus assembly protein PilF
MMQLAGRRVGQAQSAADWLELVEQATPDDQVAERVALADAWMVAGGRLSMADASAQSARILEGLIADHPESPQANLARAILFERRGELGEAEQYYRRTLDLEPESYVAMNNLAMVLSQDESKLDEARSFALQVVQARPNVAAFHDTAAHIFKLQGEYADAVTHLMQAMEAEPQEPEWQINLAEVLVLAGRVDQARELYEKLNYLTLEPQKLRKTWRDKLQWIDQQLQAASADPSSASGSAAPSRTMPVN